MAASRWLAAGLLALSAIAAVEPLAAQAPSDIETLRRSAAAARESGDGAVLVDALSALGRAQASAGHYRAAIERLREALAVADTFDERRREAQLLAELGDVRQLVGQPELALRSAGSAVTIARKLGDGALEALARNNRGNALLALGRDEEAAADFEAAIDGAAAGGQWSLATRVRVNLARLELRRERREAARAHLDAALDAAARLPSGRERAMVALGLGRLAERIHARGHPHDETLLLVAHGLFEESAAIGERLADGYLLSYAHGYLGGLYERGGRHAEAARLTRTALFHALDPAAGVPAYQWHWQLARTHRAGGDIGAALDAYQAAIGSLQAVRPALGAGARDGREALEEIVSPLLFQYADLLLRDREPRESEAGYEARLNLARNTIELLKAAELEDYYQDDCVARLRARTRGIDQLDPSTAVLYLIPLDDRLEILVTLRDGTERVRVAVGRAALSTEVERFRRRLETRNTRRYRRHGRQLFDWVVRPIVPLLEAAGVDTLVFVPHGVLQTVPLAALQDGDRFLIESYAVATTPGLSLTDPRTLARDDMEVLVGALSESVAGFSPLPYVSDEVSGIGSIYRTRDYRNEDFLVDNLRSALERQPYAVLHIASHGQFERDLDDTFVLAYDERISMERLRSLVGISEFRERPVELLTLSACETATGDVHAALGLAGIAVKAGARSALATLWAVDDVSSAELVVSFYEHLTDPGISKARALQQAQIALKGDRRYRHPFYWAPFQLIGNWL